jgi:predicted neutral ceramidase superfamily lipid hydrolase
MIKHPPADDSEATLAAMAYIPGLALFVWLTLETGKSQYFLRYHVIHAVLLNLTSLLALLLAATLGFIPSAPTSVYMIMGVAIVMTLVVASLVHGIAAMQAYRKRLVVLPLLTPLYYRFFANS